MIEEYPTLDMKIKEVDQFGRLIEYPINPVNPNQVMFMGSVSHTFGISARGEGIWLVDLDGTGLKQIR